jgi:hypothetical protein
MTVDSLHASFEQIDAKVRHMISKGCTNSGLEYCIRRLWSQQFHQSLSRPAMIGMISHYRALYGSGRKTRKSQQGGMAPLDYVGGQGTAAVYGRFPVLEGSSPKFVSDLGTVNRTFESSIGPACTAQAGGSRKKQKGGGIFDSLSYGLTGAGVGESIRMGHAPSSVAANSLQRMVGTVQASPVPGRSDPTDPAWKMAAFDPKPFDAAAQSTFQLSPVYMGY